MKKKKKTKTIKHFKMINLKNKNNFHFFPLKTKQCPQILIDTIFYRTNYPVKLWRKKFAKDKSMAMSIKVLSIIYRCEQFIHSII